MEMRSVKVIYWIPGVMGVLIYFVFVGINDLYSPEWNRWSRGWLVNGSEVLLGVFIGYMCTFIVHYWEHKFREKDRGFSVRVVFGEFAKVYLSTALLLNGIGGSLMHWIDGYDSHDILLVNTIPVIVTLLYFAVLRGNYYIQKLVEARTLAEKLTNDKLNEELKFLRNQIHPHFLFNALNTIYFQMDESVTGAKKTIEKFSELLRYRLYNEDKGKVSLVEEYNYLEGYIEMEQLKHDGRLRVVCDLKYVEGTQVYPFLMLPLLENAFKYVGGDLKISLKGRVEEAEFRFEISNTKHKDATLYEGPGGIGLKNLRRRLELLYPEDHQLEIDDNEEAFQVQLTINL